MNLAMLDTPVVEATEKEPRFTTKILASNHERGIYRGELADLENLAFANDAERKKHNVNFVRDMPDVMYFDPNSIIVVLENDDTGVVEGFTILEKRDDHTYYVSETAIRNQGRGHSKILLRTRDDEIRNRGNFSLLSHVTNGCEYAKSLERTYTQLPLEQNDQVGLAPHQKALRYKI